jgi:DNA-binding transcriptional regulator YdaS (Cro superfamily)
MQEIVKRAARLSGGITALAGALKINRQAIYQWSRIPAERVIPVERISGISREELRPDLFGPGAPTFSEPENRALNDMKARTDGSFLHPIHDTGLSQRPSESSAPSSALDSPGIATSSSISSCGEQGRRESAEEKS